MVRWVETSVARFFEIFCLKVAFVSSFFGVLPNYTFFARNRNVFVIFVQKVSQVFRGTGFQPRKVPKVGADSYGAFEKCNIEIWCFWWKNMFFQCTSGKWSSEISSQKSSLFWNSEAKYWTESPNEFLKNSEKQSLFGAILIKRTPKDLCGIIAFDRLEDLEKRLFWWKRAKIDAKTVIFWVFFVRFCPQT